MRRAVLCGILTATMLVGCSSTVENTQSIQLQSAVSERQMKAAEIAPEKEASKTNISVKVQTNADPEQEAAIAKARAEAAAIAEVEVAAWMQMGLENAEIAAAKIEEEKEAREVAKAEKEKEAQEAAKAEKEKKAREAAKAKKEKEAQEAAKAEEEKDMQAATKTAKEKEAQATAKAKKEKKTQVTAKAEKEKTEAAAQEAATPLQTQIDTATQIPAQIVQNEAAVVEVSRIYIEDCGSDSGYWQITYSDGHIEYIDD